MNSDRSAGFTLLEIIIVLVIIGFLSTLGVRQFRSTFASESRQVGWRISSTIRYLYTLAITEKMTVRLVFNFDKNTYSAEAMPGTYLMETAEEAEVRKKREEKQKEFVARLESSRPTADKGEEEGASGDSEPPPDQDAAFAGLDRLLLQETASPHSVYLKDIQTSRDPQPVTQGMAYIYFFPSGYVEPSIINLRDENDEKFLSLSIDPLSGNVDVEREYRQLARGGS